jgi:hypothetical protein
VQARGRSLLAKGPKYPRSDHNLVLGVMLMPSEVPCKLNACRTTGRVAPDLKFFL